jgi:D-alanyl-D-alanine carboxypeptidase/D-alanyl-D-alanine-endopeptidase (penicillin-binding protein 4)
MQDPAAWYLAALKRTLAEAGIDVGPGAGGGATQLVYVHRSGLRQAILRMLEDSSNFDAEQCLRVLGHRTRRDGSLAGGLASLRQQITALVGPVPEGAVLADGSGLSKDNRLTPGLLVVALFKSRSGPAGAMLMDCLPVAGRSGTLSDRFTGTGLVGRVRAKTGWIRGASALSGMVERQDGGVRWFSILMNYEPKKNGLNNELKALQERIVQAIEAMGSER